MERKIEKRVVAGSTLPPSRRGEKGVPRLVTLGTALFVIAAVAAMVHFERAAAPRPSAGSEVTVATEVNISPESLPPPGQSAEFYAEYKLERERNRSRQMEVLREMIQAKDTSPVVKNDAQRRLLSLLEMGEKEMQLESLLLAEGFVQPLVFLTEDGATVCVAGPELTPAMAAKIGDLTTRITKLLPQQVVIMVKNPVYMEPVR